MPCQAAIHCTAVRRQGRGRTNSRQQLTLAMGAAVRRRLLRFSPALHLRFCTQLFCYSVVSNDVYVLAHGKYKFGQNFPCDWVVVVVGKVCVCMPARQDSDAYRKHHCTRHEEEEEGEHRQTAADRDIQAGKGSE